MKALPSLNWKFVGIALVGYVLLGSLLVAVLEAVFSNLPKTEIAIFPQLMQAAVLLVLAYVFKGKTHADDTLVAWGMGLAAAFYMVIHYLVFTVPEYFLKLKLLDELTQNPSGEKAKIILGNESALQVLERNPFTDFFNEPIGLDMALICLALLFVGLAYPFIAGRLRYVETRKGALVWSTLLSFTAQLAVMLCVSVTTITALILLRVAPNLLTTIIHEAHKLTTPLFLFLATYTAIYSLYLVFKSGSKHP